MTLDIDTEALFFPVKVKGSDCPGCGLLNTPAEPSHRYLCPVAGVGTADQRRLQAAQNAPGRAETFEARVDKTAAEIVAEALLRVGQSEARTRRKWKRQSIR